MGQLAQDKAASSDVKQFGQTLTTDHMKANAELKRIAQQQNIQLPSVPTKSGAIAGQKLQDLSGAKFDEAFVHHQIADHKNDIEAFRREARSGSDPAMKAFAEKTLPVLEKHLRIAESLATQMQSQR